MLFSKSELPGSYGFNGLRFDYLWLYLVMRMFLVQSLICSQLGLSYVRDKTCQTNNSRMNMICANYRPFLFINLSKSPTPLVTVLLSKLLHTIQKQSLFTCDKIERRLELTVKTVFNHNKVFYSISVPMTS